MSIEAEDSAFDNYVYFVQDSEWPGKVNTRRDALDKLSEEANEVFSVGLNFDDSEDMREELRLELGDLLNLIITVGDLHEINIWSTIYANKEKLSNRAKFGKGGYGKRS